VLASVRSQGTRSSGRGHVDARPGSAPALALGHAHGRASGLRATGLAGAAPRLRFARRRPRRPLLPRPRRRLRGGHGGCGDRRRTTRRALQEAATAPVILRRFGRAVRRRIRNPADPSGPDNGIPRVTRRLFLVTSAPGRIWSPAGESAAGGGSRATASAASAASGHNLKGRAGVRGVTTVATRSPCATFSGLPPAARRSRGTAASPSPGDAPGGLSALPSPSSRSARPRCRDGGPAVLRRSQETTAFSPLASVQSPFRPRTSKPCPRPPRGRRAGRR